MARFPSLASAAAGFLKARLPPRLRRRLRRWRLLLQRRPESTFMRVAYTTPRQVVLITTRHHGKDNVWPVDWHVPLSSVPPLYGIALNRNGYGAELIGGSGVFDVNFVPAAWEKAIVFCGNVSGRDVDKFAAAGFQTEPSESVDAPRLAGALGALECRVQQAVPLGDHVLFIGAVTREVLRAEAPRLHHIDVRMGGTGHGG